MEGVEPAFWAVIPASVRYSQELPAGAKLLYAEITSLVKEKGYCYASNAYFQRLYGISEPTVQRHLRALKKLGFIQIEDGEGGSGRRKIYAGLNPLSVNPIKNDGVAENPIKNEGGTPSKMTPDPLKNDTQNSKENKKEEHPPKPPRGRRGCKDRPDYEPERFARFWAAYPCGKDKQGAMREWDSLRPDADLMRVMAGALKRQLATEEWQRGVGIPYACRWLKYRRWEDELGKGRGAEQRTVEAPEEVPRW